MTDLQSIINMTVKTDGYGVISINKISGKTLKKINNMIVFHNKNKLNDLHTIYFKDDRFLPNFEEIPFSFANLTKNFSYELKVITLSFLFLGQTKNYKIIKWSTARSNLRVLKRFAMILIDQGLDSFRELDKLTPIALQNIGELIYADFNKSNETFVSKLSTLVHYALIKNKTLEYILHNYKDEKNKSSKSNSFTIIPNNVLLTLFSKINEYKINFIKEYVIWKKYNQQDILRINQGKYYVIDGKYFSTKQHDSISGVQFISILNKFRKVVIFNTLLFTGMRKDEVKELKNNCVKNIDDTYFVISSLSKTTPYKCDFEWMSSESCNEMLSLLIDINTEMKKRVRAIINTHDKRFSPEYISHLKSNLMLDRIFCFDYSLNRCVFTSTQFIIKNDLNKNYSVFKISLDQLDIDQLNFLECNYKSVVPNSSNYMIKYCIGDYFNFSPHQFRHTFSYFMIANNLCTIRQIKHQFKHASSIMNKPYTKRAIYSQLIKQSKTIDDTIKIKVLMGFSVSIGLKNCAGGGVKYILNALNLKDFKYNISIDPINLKGLDEINSYLLRNRDSINFLPHGFCMNGSDCALKSISVPLDCINCFGYITTDSNLPYWRGLLIDIQDKLSKINLLPTDKKKVYENLTSNLKEKEIKLQKIIDSLNGNKIETIEVI